MLHLSHGAGTFFCQLAKRQGERTRPTGDCNLRGFKPFWEPPRTNCETLRSSMVDQGITFGGIERGLLDGEFCPDTIAYTLLMRHPLERMDSMA